MVTTKHEVAQENFRNAEDKAWEEFDTACEEAAKLRSATRAAAMAQLEKSDRDFSQAKREAKQKREDALGKAKEAREQATR